MGSEGGKGAASSEEVLMQVKHVKYKKLEGILYLLETRLGWLTASSSAFRALAYYTDIQTLRISPDTKAKVQLQVTPSPFLC